MSAFVVATSVLKNPEKFAEYGKAAGATLAAHGGALAKKGKFAGSLTTNSEHNTVAVIEFPDLDAIKGWYNSSEYQAVIPLREEACDMTISSYEVPTA